MLDLNALAQDAKAMEKDLTTLRGERERLAIETARVNQAIANVEGALSYNQMLVARAGEKATFPQEERKEEPGGTQKGNGEDADRSSV